MLAKFRGTRALSATFAVFVGLIVFFVASGLAQAAPSGSGTMIVAGTTAAGGQSGQSFVFTFSGNATPAFGAGSAVALTIQAAPWPPLSFRGYSNRTVFLRPRQKLPVLDGGCSVCPIPRW